jgi:hypothetical protein
MTRRTQVLLTSAIAALLLSSCRSDKGLVGTWTSVARGKGGVATVVEFRPDGSFVSSYDTILDCSYKLQGDQLVISTVDARSGQTSADFAEARFDGDALVLKAPWDGTEYAMQRAQPKRQADPAIVGRWVSGATGPHPAFADFAPDGKLSFRQRLKSVVGKYSVSSDSLTLNFEGSPAQKGTFKIEGDSLILTPEKGARQVFTKTAPGN